MIVLRFSININTFTLLQASGMYPHASSEYFYKFSYDIFVIFLKKGSSLSLSTFKRSEGAYSSC